MTATGALGGIAAAVGVVTALVSANGNIAPPTLPGLGSPASLSGQTIGPSGPSGLSTDLPSLPTDLPTTLPTGLPTDLPTALPTDLSSLLPTGGAG
jgi:hypothetical protein